MYVVEGCYVCETLDFGGFDHSMEAVLTLFDLFVVAALTSQPQIIL